MSIASAIQNKQQQVAAAYTICNNKGATMPTAANRNMSNMATTISSIQTDTPINNAIEKLIKTTDGNNVVTYTRESEIVGANYIKLTSTKFYNNTNIVAILLPDTVVTIDQHAVRGCSNLNYINLENVQVINDSAFRDSNLNDDLYLPNLTSLRNWTFAGSKIKRVTSLGNITVLSANTFNACPNLVEVNLSSLITEIGASALQNCGELTTVTIQATTPPTISSGLFNRCFKLERIYVPSDSVTAYKNASNWSAYANLIYAIPVPYIHLQNNGYWRADVIPVSGDEMTVQFEIFDDNNVAIAGSRASTSSDNDSFLVAADAWGYNYRPVKAYLLGNMNVSPQAISKNTFYTVTASYSSASASPSLGTFTTNGTYSFTQGYPIGVGILNCGNGTVSRLTNGNIYSVEISNNGVVKHKLLPQSDLSLFDTITERKYPITGTGTYYDS